MERYIFDIEKSNNPGEWPVNIYVRRVNIDPDGYAYCESHGKTLKQALKRALTTILDKEENANASRPNNS